MSSLYPIIHALNDSIDASLEDIPFDGDAEKQIRQLQEERVNLDAKRLRGCKKMPM